MVPKLEDIKGGGGSIKVGTTGTISNLMSRELETLIRVPQPLLPSIKISTSSESVSVPCQALTPRKLKPKPPINGASTSESTHEGSRKSPENNGQRVKQHNRRSSQLPMLKADNVSLEATPHRGKPDRRGGSNIVEIVDIKCGHPDRAWPTPITSRLKKLGFSKLSENSIV